MNQDGFMEENRRFFRADIDVKKYFRPLESNELDYWIKQIDLGCHEDLCREYIAGEVPFLKGVENLADNKDDLKDLLLFLNDKVNCVLNATPMMKDHPLNNIEEEQVNLGGGGCALIQEYSMSLNSYALVEIILPRNSKYIRTIVKTVHSVPAGSKWRNGYSFEKISIEDQDSIMAYLFQAETLDKVVSEAAHYSSDDPAPYN